MGPTTSIRAAMAHGKVHHHHHSADTVTPERLQTSRQTTSARILTEGNLLGNSHSLAQ